MSILVDHPLHYLYRSSYSLYLLPQGRFYYRNHFNLLLLFLFILALLPLLLLLLPLQILAVGIVYLPLVGSGGEVGPRRRLRDGSPLSVGVVECL